MKLHTLNIVLALSYVAAGKSCKTRPTATIDSGPVVGVATQLAEAPHSVNKFLGIPFAGKPERFSLAKPPAPWHDPFKADEFGPSCPQYYLESELVMDPETMKRLAYGDPKLAPPESEDCLSINVFTPSSTKTSSPLGKPVLLYIHGGGWHLGNGIADLSHIAAQEGIIAVSFNYRTNIFGFPNTYDIPVKERNLGLYDQRLAIDWVQRNIAAFGGDPTRVTLWGVSAGSISIDMHLHAYKDEKELPFRAVIQMSGQASWGWLASTSDANSTEQWSAVAKALGCTDERLELECMQRVSIEYMKKVSNELHAAYSPVVDEITVPGQRAKAWRDGDVALVPILTSTTAEEGRGLINRELNLKTFMETYLPEGLVDEETRRRILSYYQQRPDLKSEFDIVSAIYTDFFFQCGQALQADASAALENPTWRFVFNQSVLELLPEEFQYLGKFHGSDAVLLLSLPLFESGFNGTQPFPELVDFGKYYRRMVANFAKNPEAGPGWPQVGSRDGKPCDIASLGDLGERHFTILNRTEVDEACGLYKDIYVALEQSILE